MPNTDYLEVELLINDDQAEVVLSKNKQRLKDFAADVERTQPNIKFTIDGKPYIDLDKLEKKAAETRKSFEEITKVRLDRGQIGFLTKEIIVTTERARQLQSDISGIKRELANPNRKSSIAFLTDELKAAEREADVLNRKLSTVSGQNGQSAPSGPKGAAEQVSSKLGRLRGFGAIFRAAGLPQLGINESEINAALAGIDLFNEHYAKTAKIAQATSTAVSAASAVEVATTTEAAAAKTALTAATSASTAATVASTAATTAEGAAVAATTTAVEAEAAAFAGITTAALISAAALGASVAVAGAAIVHITSDIRDEAERRLHLEEKIAHAYGEQYSALYKIRQESDKNRADADRDRKFTRNLNTESLDQLEEQKTTTKFLLDRTGDAERAKQYSKELSEIDAKIDEIKEKRKADFDKAYADNTENYRKSLEQAAKYENDRIEKQNAAAKKRLEDLEKAKTKIDELGKKATETFDNLFVSSSKDNPFAQIFSESDRAIDKLRENLKGLSPELRAVAFQLQQKTDSNKLFQTRLDNSLGVFALRDEAGNFRNPKTDSLVDKNRFDEIIKQNISQGNFFNGAFGNFGSDASNRAGGFDKLTDQQKRDIYESATLNNAKLSGANPSDFISFLARQRSAAFDDPNATLQERLQKQIDIVGSSSPKTDDEKSIADRKLIALTQGLDPLKLTSRENDIAAQAREREAVRRENAEKDADKDRKEQIKLQKRIADNQEKLLKLAEKEGLKGLEKLLVEVRDSPTTKSTVTRANPADTAKQMDLSGTYFEQSQR